MTRFDDIQARHDTYVCLKTAGAWDADKSGFIAHCPDDLGWLLDRVKELEAERETGPTPHKCLNDECETVAYGTGYDACPSCGDTSGRDVEPT